MLLGKKRGKESCSFDFMMLVFFFNLYLWIILHISSSTFGEPPLSRTEYTKYNWYKCAQITFPFSPKTSQIFCENVQVLVAVSLTCPHPPVDGHLSLHPGPPHNKCRGYQGLRPDLPLPLNGASGASGSRRSPPFPIRKFHFIHLRSLQRKEGGVRGDEASIRLEEVSPSLPLNLF